MESTDFPLYTTFEKPCLKITRGFACIFFTGILALVFYRISYMPREDYFPWIMVFAAELGFAFIWALEQAFRWRPVTRYTFPERLSERFENDLPPVDIFICTADPIREPPMNVVDTVLSTLAHDYPTEKLSCYVSDDGGSALTFYALFEASMFAKIWVPFCHKYFIQQRCPDAYFSESDAHQNKSLLFATEWEKLKTMYEEMKHRINSTVETGIVPEAMRNRHDGFREWSSGITLGDHHSIVQILLEKGKDGGVYFPRLVYVSREKRPGCPHNFKAGALNVLIRVSALMSNAPFILTLDCDMYANNCKALREAMCFLMDPQTGHQFGYVQFPQRFHGITKYDLYANHLKRIFDIQGKGIDGAEGPIYVGTGCVHRRDVLCGSEPQNVIKASIESANLEVEKECSSEILNKATTLASCTYEENSLWGKKVGIMYGCVVEDVLTAFTIHCRGWKSAYCTPQRNAFQGRAPLNLNDTLIQHKRLTAGLFEIFVSKFCPFVYGIGRVSITLRMCYGYYCLWAMSCLHILSYGLVPALSTLCGISVFPQISSPWFLLFGFLSLSAYAYNIVEFVMAGGSVKSWWNEHRMWVIKGTSSYPFALIQGLCKSMGISEVGFEVTSKVLDSEAAKRYKEEIFEFGVASVMFIPPATITIINFISLLSGITQFVKGGYPAVKGMFVQLMLSSFIVMNGFPILEGMFMRTDKGRMPTSITMFSIMVAALACSVALKITLY
ncbi:hypothetical protein SUGI_0714190 [Cryptomeria japonica]|uniref:cellulose synthase-like protein E6 n=1 Tax=Cryptomeria japonica TaxID=3369 RepID=UPI00241480F2|nr:cellulose synthase-like protein E6 [Cryptomeria japonica]GLJ35518.1 hypothetical protein SUGI_0714190 [Cryptomeria japonica]